MPEQSQYSKVQQSISYFLIFAILFLNTFQLPMIDQTKAASWANTELVSIIVHEDIYGSISSRVKRYAEDIQAKLNNTKALIYTVPRDITPQKVAALNEKLFYEWDWSGPSRLVWTILIWDIPLPVIHNQEKTFLSIFPYVDFNEKNFIFDSSKWFYEQTRENMSDPNPEIWHSLISPNTQDPETDKIRLIDFFDKDHSFYAKSGVFSKSLAEPYVFYYDGKRDEQTVSYSLWKWYQLFLNNVEDIAYFRYTKYLAKSISDTFYASTTKESNDALKQAWAANPELLQYVNQNLGNSWPDLSKTPDVMTKKVIETLTKNFFQAFSDKYIWDILKYAYNTWRYWSPSNTRVDTVISTISKQDNAMKRMLKDANTSLEWFTDDLLKKWLARNIAVPVKIEESKSYRHDVWGADWYVCEETTGIYGAFSNNWGVGVLENFYYWKKWSSLTSANECSTIKWSARTAENKSNLVEATRADITSQESVQGDIDLLTKSPNAQTCLPNDNYQTMSFWWGYSLLNIDRNAITTSWELTLKPTDYRRATLPIYSAAGWKQVWYDKATDIQNPKTDVAWKIIHGSNVSDCLQYNLLYTAPDNLSPRQWRCDSAYSNHQAPYAFDPYTWNKFEDIYKNTTEWKVYFSPSYDYHNRHLFLDWVNVWANKSYLIWDKGDCTNYIIHSNYYYKKVLWMVEHKSPNSEEYWAQLKNMSTPSLPVDRNRYVNFTSAKWNEKKFEYPNLFRVVISESRDLNYDFAKKKVKEMLDAKSAELNAIIASENPSSLAWLDKEVYDLLKVNNAKYPSNVNFYAEISKSPELLDEIVKYVLWLNLNSAELKYKYVFEHYLDIDGNASSMDAWHKDDYEIAYLGGKWDAEDMYIRLNPEKSQDNITSDKVKGIASNYARFQATVAASRMTNQTRWSQSTDFKCWPPDGVPIFQWMPAITCWLKTLVPPITISSSSCSSSSLWIPWTSFSTDFWWDYPSITNPKYNDDENRNQIPDGAELIKDGKMELASDKWMYWYSKTIRVKANLISSPALGSKLIAVDNYSKVSFDIVKLDIYSNSKKQNIYTRKATDEPLAYKEKVAPYISFSSVKVQAKWWVADYAFSSKSTDTDVYLRATISTLDKNNKVAVYSQSEDFVVRIRGIYMDISPVVNWEVKSSFEAWSASEINFGIRTFTKDNAPINNQVPIYLNVYNELWANIEKDILIHSSSYKYKSPILTRAWEYKFVFRDNLWIEYSHLITINPSKIKEIRLTPSSTQFVKWNEVDVLVELFDAHNNRVKWDLYNVTWTITGKWEFSSNSQTTVSKWMLEWFANFKVRNTWSAWTMNLKFKAENSAAESGILTLEAVDYAKIKVNIENRDKIIVWWDKHKISLDIVGWDNKTLTKFNWVAYFEIPELYGVVQPNFTKIKDWKLTEDVFFVPNFVAGRNLKLNVSVPWIEATEGNTLTVLPEKPLYVGLTNSKSKLEAKAWVSSTLKAALYDRYGNLTFNDSSHTVAFEIPAEFKKYANFSWTSFTENVKLDDWVAKTSVFASDLPWSAFITAKVTPWLEANGYTQTDKSGNKIDIPWMSENIVSFDSYYLFNKSKTDKIDYNSLYTVLQWADYWNVTKPGYLGWELLFNKNWRSLGVTSILNNPYIRQTAFWFTPGWRYLASEWASKDQTMNIEADLSSSTQGTSIDLYDSVYKELVAKAWLNLWASTQLVNCTSNSDKDISKCQVPQNSSFIVLKWVGDVKIKDSPNKLTLELNDFSIFTITNDWKITKDPWVKFEMDTQANGNILWIRLLLNNEQIGYLGIKFDTDKIWVYDSSQFPNVLNDNKNQIVIEYLSSEYWYDYNYLWVSSHWARWISFYKIDSSEEEGVDSDLVTVNGKLWLENYTEQAWIWWEWKNKMLLEFAGWSTLWESTRYYHTYSMVNLWDPVISLETKKSATSDFDKTVWKKILEEKSAKIENYKKIDYNADGNPDVVVFYENWYIELLSNYGGNYKDMWYLAYISDAWRDRKWVWDFSGDKYEDIAFADKKWNLWILDNELGKFTRIKPVMLDLANWKETELNWAIQQLELFDMDRDGKTDLVTVDDSGELNILYWAWKKIDKYSWKLVFFKKMIDNTLWLKLESSVTKNWGAIYHDSLKQIADIWNQSQQLLESQNLLSDFKNWATSTAATNDALNTMLDKLIYYQEKYQDTASWTLSASEKEKAILSAVWTDENWNPNTWVANEILQAQNDLTILNWAWMTHLDNLNPWLLEKTRTFMRSQFAEASKIWIEKTYTDANGKFLKGDDIINVSLKITNNWTSSLNNIIYYDSNKNFLQQEWESVYTLTIGKNTSSRSLKTKDDWEFDLAFDNFSLAAWETALISYRLRMPSVSFWKVIVWLLQKNDIYGDIALNPSNQCWADQVIWASTWPRTYQKWMQKFEDKSKLPDAIEKNKVDNNNNGIPDYIEELTDNQQNDPAKAQQYSKEQMDILNKDANGNWIPDKDEEAWDSVFKFDADDWEISLGGLNSANIDSINSSIDWLVNSMGCWFWWWACISVPMNWAPLAPGWSMTLFWMPVTTWIWLVGNSTALPIFSFPTSCGPIVIWPPCPSWAGWMFWPPMWGWSSMIRLFVTPTITWAVWMAMCFGPNTSAYIKSPWVDPMIPGWQCVVAAVPLAWCSDDGSDGNVGSQGFSSSSSSGSGSSSWNSFLNANACTKKEDAKWTISTTTHNNIIKYLLGDKNVTKDILSDAAVQHWWLNPDNGPLIWFWGWWDWNSNLDISIDANALTSLDAWNIVKANFSRVSSFPDFIMDWITRQFEEIINKLTTLPTLYIILPDFSWFADSGWSDIVSNYNKAKGEIAKKEAEKNKKAQPTGNPQSFEDAKDKLKWLSTKMWLQGGTDNIKSAYEVMSNLPLIKMQSEMIDVNIPWVGPEDWTKFIEKAKAKKKQYAKEIERAKEDWKELKWKPWYDKHFKMLLDAENLVKSLDKNIQTLEEMKKFPEKFRKYITWKEHFITQIMCNLDIINKVTGWWIVDNGKRFKAWVELIVLLKAILKSYQMIVDVFADFNASCSVCHNERNNLTYWIIKLISAMIPKLPIIVFPKWPDIIIDLHNIRAWLNITVPEFRFKVIPMVIPELPDLYLPKVPNVNVAISLPAIPQIPGLPELPDLPDLPSLPDVKLPDLPPPPKIPNIFWSIQAALQLVKLIAKVLCLYRQIWQLLPPEWRAWDAIAWMTERNWTLPFDKLFIDMPQFSVPFVDAIKVTSYVNLEFDVDFIVEMAKSTLEPFNRFANDMWNLWKWIKLPDIDMRPLAPDDVNIDVNVAPDLQGYDMKKAQDKNIAYIAALAWFTIGWIWEIVKWIENWKKELELWEFKEMLKKSASKLATTNDPKEKLIYNTINRAVDFDASSNDPFIKWLWDKNNEKYSIIKRMLQDELKKNASLGKELSLIESGKMPMSEFSPLQKLKNDAIKVSATSPEYDNLKSSLQKNQSRIAAPLESLTNPQSTEAADLKAAWDDLINKVSEGLKTFKKEINEGIPVEVQTSPAATPKSFAAPESSSDQASSWLDYGYNYEWVYVINSQWKQTRLFDYLDEVDKDTNVIELDYDNDSDQDVIYKMGDTLYLKTNLSKKPASANHISGVDSVRDISDINGYLWIDNNTASVPLAPNFFQELTTSSNNINFNFIPSNRDKDNSFRLEYYDYINRFDTTDNQKQFNKSIFPYARLNLVDLVTNMRDENILTTKPWLIVKSNFATLDVWVWSALVSMQDYKVLGAGDSIIVQQWKIIYAWESGLTIEYKMDWDANYKKLILDKRTNVEFLDKADVTVTNGNMILLYSTKKDFNWDIAELRWFPIQKGTYIEFANKNWYANINYVWWWMLTIDNWSTYEMYGLWERNDRYSVNLSRDNSFYYAKLYEFSNAKKSNMTSMSLMSPQFEADKEAPLLWFEDGIKLPVYKKQIFNLKQYINDISGISELFVDFDPKADSDWDWIIDNDKDSLNPSNAYWVRKWSTWYDVDFWPFDKPSKKKILISVKDNNDNVATSLVDLEVYSPVPQIINADLGKIIWSINENISEEPIDIMRYRDGVLEKIKTSAQDKTQNNWAFDISTLSSASWAVIKSWTDIVANVNEVTWKIDLKDTKYSISVSGADKDSKTRIEIFSKEKWNIIYWQSFSLPSNENIQWVASLDNLDRWIYFKADNPAFSLIKNPIDAPTLPNWAFIKDSSTNKAILWIGNDGNVYIIDSSYKLNYSSKWDYVLLGVSDGGGNQVWSIYFKVNSVYIIK
ncbi:MAG: hypothetical protein ACD_2C00141G0001 [uncultured bacterium (gcode 4)]|uniref:Uncharacterized protein n=1 Tax=uncultured bacterium (gcode 4) TaxID=1234023 RepID=K2GGN3_9BACT|nr:MAG: hypothetical protein ACD_2C00141G0001 [uncultured bacterium (gcode 4)]